MDRLRTHAGAILGAGLAVAALSLLWMKTQHWIDRQEALRERIIAGDWKNLAVAVEEMDGKGAWRARDPLSMDAQMTNDRSSVGGPVYELRFEAKALGGKWSLSRIVSARCGGEEVARMEMSSPESALGRALEWSCGEARWRFTVVEEKVIARVPIAKSIVPMPPAAP